MRDEFFNLKSSDDPFEWIFNLRSFLNKWGMWSYPQGFEVSIRNPAPDFVLVHPHLPWGKREEYRNALREKHARKWLSSAKPLSFSTTEHLPYFLVERFYCEDAIEATITIDHLAGRRFGFCKRCGRQFEQETRHRKNYCSRQCIAAAGVKRWRQNQRKASRKVVKGNVKG
jgi:hypothetical protein